MNISPDSFRQTFVKVNIQVNELEMFLFPVYYHTKAMLVV
jgi:hypothetical protein